MADFLHLTKLTIYVGEDFFYKDKPFYKAIFDIAGKYKIAGCTVLRGTQGYGEPGAGGRNGDCSSVFPKPSTCR